MRKLAIVTLIAVIVLSAIVAISYRHLFSRGNEAPLLPQAQIGAETGQDNSHRLATLDESNGQKNYKQSSDIEYKDKQLPAILTIKVADATGNTINGAKVFLAYSNSTGKGRTLGKGVYVTNEQGIVEVMSLNKKDENINITVESDGYIEKSAVIENLQPLEEKEVIIRLEKGNIIEGIIKGVGDGDEKHITIHLLKRGNKPEDIWSKDIVVKNDGAFYCSDAPISELEMSIRHRYNKYLPKHLTVKPNSGIIAVELAPNPKMANKGKIILKIGGNIGGAQMQITFCKEDGKRAKYENDSENSFLLDEGAYTIFATTVSPEGMSFYAMEKVYVKVAIHQEITLTPQIAGRVKGRIVDSLTKLPIVNAFAEVETTNMLVPWYKSSGFSDDKGYFTIRNIIESGVKSIRVRAEDYIDMVVDKMVTMETIIDIGDVELKAIK